MAKQPTPGGLPADLVLVVQGSIPIASSGRRRRSACVERYSTCASMHLDVPA